MRVKVRVRAIKRERKTESTKEQHTLTHTQKMIINEVIFNVKIEGASAHTKGMKPGEMCKS